MLGKILTFALLGMVIYFMLKSKLNKKLNSSDDDELIKCKNCGVFVSKNELKDDICQSCRSKI